MLVLLHRESGARLKLPAAVLARLRRFGQASSQALEAGGVLIGRRIDGSLDAIIDTITRPCATDRRTRTSFYRSAPHHQRLVEQAWRRSNGMLGYLGEWHTHPEPRPTASSVDLRDWRRRLREDVVDAADVYFLIVGTADITGWRGDRRLVTIDELAVVPSADCRARRSS